MFLLKIPQWASYNSMASIVLYIQNYDKPGFQSACEQSLIYSGRTKNCKHSSMTDSDYIEMYGRFWFLPDCDMRVRGHISWRSESKTWYTVDE